MIAYAIGRIGCQVAGDGDWGYYNAAFQTDAAGHLSSASPSTFEQTIRAHPEYFSADISEFGKVPSLSFSKPASLNFLPNWFFAYNYPNNVNRVGISLAGCTEQHCKQLPVPTFPTPFYETIACTLLFFVLWGLRKRMRPYGTLFALYLILNGLERFFIEKIRVNNKLDLFGMQVTQAEIISTGLVIFGAALWVLIIRRYRTKDV
jgi:prolipoprotein diacylglyceryltransferase